MKLFTCQRCGQGLYFENAVCGQCGAALGYLPALFQLSALADASQNGAFHPLADRQRRSWRFCANHAAGSCNWMLPADDAQGLCPACRLNRTIPDLSAPGNATLWQRLEQAKHRLVYGLMRLGLPLTDRQSDPQTGLAFDFLDRDAPNPHRQGPILTGHADGVITIVLSEADSALREANRQSMGETYRTLLGHFRHESGHYYWDRLVRDRGGLQDFRAVFGDERLDYAAALDSHYRQGPPGDWQDRFVSAYASAHPWEDFAESWAHYLHIIDTLETAESFGIRSAPAATNDPAMAARIDFDPYGTEAWQDILDAWFPLTLAVNELNRSMGQPDLYPFVLSAQATEKLRFIHTLITDNTVPAA